MTSPSAVLYRYTPGSVGMVRIFCNRSMGEECFLLYLMGEGSIVLQKWKMSRLFAHPSAFFRSLFWAAGFALTSLCSAQPAPAQTAPSAQSNPAPPSAQSGQNQSNQNQGTGQNQSNLPEIGKSA